MRSGPPLWAFPTTPTSKGRWRRGEGGERQAWGENDDTVTGSALIRGPASQGIHRTMLSEIRGGAFLPLPASGGSWPPPPLPPDFMWPSLLVCLCLSSLFVRTQVMTIKAHWTPTQTSSYLLTAYAYFQTRKVETKVQGLWLGHTPLLQYNSTPNVWQVPEAFSCLQQGPDAKTPFQPTTSQTLWDHSLRQDLPLENVGKPQRTLSAS